MKVYIKFIIKNFLKSLIFVSAIIFCLIFILNLLTELEFFRQIDVKYYFPIYVSILNTPSLLFELFPFVFLISSQVCFFNLFSNQQIETLKYSGLKNSNILSILLYTSLVTGFILIFLFYNLSSNLKNIYLELKNNFTTDDKYLAVVTNNGLWIKDGIDEKTYIVNATKINNKFLLEVSISELDDNFNVRRHIESEKIDISNNNWLIFNPVIYSGNEKNKQNKLIINSNFDYERIQSLFSNLSSLSIFELFELKENYQILSLSTIEVDIQIQKLLSYPIYLCLMTILASIIMFNSKKIQSNTFKISIGLFLSVLIYYINNFFFVMGETEKINLILSVWGPIIFLVIINSIFILKINDK